MKTMGLALILAVTTPAVAMAQAAPAAPAATTGAHYSTTETELGKLLDDPAAKAVLNKYIPALISSDQIDMARSLTLKALQSYAGDALTDETLGKIDIDLAKLPAKS